jgi:hypothetical protein
VSVAVASAVDRRRPVRCAYASKACAAGVIKCLPNGQTQNQSTVKAIKTVCDIPNAFNQSQWKKKSKDEKENYLPNSTK